MASDVACFVESLGAEMLLHILVNFCRARDMLRVGETSLQGREAMQLFPLSLSRFPQHCLVRLRDRGTLLHVCDAANRGDLTEGDAAELEGREGLVVGKHPTNGIAVRFMDAETGLPCGSLGWFEPMCLQHVGRLPPREDVQDRRFFPGQKVRINDPGSRWLEQEGTVQLRSSLPEGKHSELSVRFAGQTEELVRAEMVTPVSRFFGCAEASGLKFASQLSLSPFVLGCRVRVREKPLILASFDAANRDDYFEYMDAFCGQEGVVDQLHATNGVRVNFLAVVPTSLWFEPPGLELLDPPPETSSGSDLVGQRWLVGERVRLHMPSSACHGRVGVVQLHFHSRDYTKVTVRFSDGHEEYVSEAKLSAARSFY
ncbi:unnamed protein product [Polarella glacialis]|uniref:Uncharacterized protein n=1 Tax=Polarella glacialis TaxID=89957 RepID=A0A813FSF5_POLGL|nr:unnamed protein product [Polarella glacialis]CAE8717645.1 unnamed protein product [Polarella glacialis]